MQVVTIKDEELLSKFGKLALTKSRKQEMPLTVVAHNNTQACLFGIKSLHNLVSKMLQVECLALVDTITLQPKSTGKAKVKLDSSNEWLDVHLPTMSVKISDFSSPTPAESNPYPPIDKATLERIYELEFNLSNKAESNPIPSLTPLAQSLLQYLQRTGRTSAVIQEIQPNFKVKGQRFSSEELKRLFNELVENSLAVWLDANTIKIASNQTDGQNGQE
ncbi:MULTISPECIES: hypothetical protein [Nostoc]|uniref:Uncharacterized protein n=1 Tax=Nostoc paludosum FACHB-159 TaxID=2692908 RepID=A0ABR8KH65_9NOSO|nr:MULTISPECIES: hypothetical protein [Nostoc]MBD2682536.1 hypothetical protein [Nostoc sp. FACHB-857]MBD2738868.1 hypothetical protein [Nostoc paludosum FACHB-159]